MSEGRHPRPRGRSPGGHSLASCGSGAAGRSQDLAYAARIVSIDRTHDAERGAAARVHRSSGDDRRVRGADSTSAFAGGEAVRSTPRRRACRSSQSDREARSAARAARAVEGRQRYGERATGRHQGGSPRRGLSSIVEAKSAIPARRPRCPGSPKGSPSARSSCVTSDGCRPSRERRPSLETSSASRQRVAALGEAVDRTPIGVAIERQPRRPSRTESD